MKQYQVSIVPGLANVVSQELNERFGTKPAGTSKIRNAEILSLAYAGDPRNLLDLRTVEDVFLALGRVKLTGQLADMKALSTSPIWGVPIREALGVWSRTTGRPLVKRLQFRVVAQADDVAWRQYRRQELMLAAERALMNVGTSWRLVREVAPLEIWLQQAGRELLVSVRLSTGEMRQHGGREVERGAALRPSVAAAMVRLSRPEPDDVFLDPMCGTGTILLERAAAGRYQMLLGGDIDQAAVDAALANFGPRHQPRRIERWDATRLPLKDGSVSRVATNLPWGRQIGEQSKLPDLYAGVLHEAVRVLAPGGRMVVITSEWDLLKQVLKQVHELRLDQMVPNVEVLGRRADIFVLGCGPTT